jgi:sulfopyruvate decarboxylase subunit alpha
MPWQEGLARALHDRGVEVIAYVPDGRLDAVARQLGDVVRTLTREEECVAFAAGYGAAGGRAAVLMQCSGLGNSLNALGSFAIPYRIGIPLVVSMRGTLGESNPSQVAMGRATPALLAGLGIQAFSAHRPEEVAPTAAGVMTLAYDTGMPAALLLEPSLGGRSEAR